MIDIDSIKEIISTIKQNKLRTFLTGFSISWGIFILIVLLGSGNGLKNGVASNFSRRAANTITVWPGTTSLPYSGMPTDRVIKFDYKDYNLIKNDIEGVTHITPYIDKSATISYRQEYGSWRMRGIYPDALFINNLIMEKGRFINDYDVKEKRKYIVLSPQISEILFKEENPLGRYVVADSIAYKVVGVYKDEGSMGNPPAYIPFSTGQALYKKSLEIERIDFIIPTLDNIPKSQAFEKQFRTKMGLLHKFNPDDRSALYIRNTAEEAAQANQIFGALNLAIWVIGFLTLVAGVVGIGNIMLITVKERTREFGIRKAIGATPDSILSLVVLESIMITTAFGYIGMVLGIGIMEIISYGLDATPRNFDEPVIFLNPTIGIGVIVQATATLIIAGVVAGLIPAIKAVRVKPIEAMHAE